MPVHCWSTAFNSLLLSTLTFIQQAHLQKRKRAPWNSLLYVSEAKRLFLARQPPPQWARASSLTRILDHTQRRTTVSRPPLDKWSAHYKDSRPQWPRGLRRRSTAVRLLGSWVQIPPGARTFVCCDCCVLSGRGPCDELAPRPGKFYRLWCVVVCNFETSWMRSQNKAGWTAGRRTQQNRQRRNLGQNKIPSYSSKTRWYRE